jgi:hypothetical protein
MDHGQNRAGVSLPSREDVKGSIFRTVVFSSYLEFRAMDEAPKTSDSEGEISLIFAVNYYYQTAELPEPKYLISIFYCMVKCKDKKCFVKVKPCTYSTEQIIHVFKYE